MKNDSRTSGRLIVRRLMSQRAWDVTSVSMISGYLFRKSFYTSHEAISPNEISLSKILNKDISLTESGRETELTCRNDSLVKLYFWLSFFDKVKSLDVTT